MIAERVLIDRYFKLGINRQDVIVGVGDDAAVVKIGDQKLAISIDGLICGSHFDADANPYLLGRKSLSAALADLAATGAKPLWALISLALPDLNHSWLKQFAKGTEEILAEHNLALIGGDLVRGKTLSITTTVIGKPTTTNFLKQTGAKPGHSVWLSGEVGAAASEFIQTGGLGNKRKSILLNPVARLNLGQRLAALKVSAATDLSDGLLRAAELIATNSKLTLKIHWQQVPLAKQLAKLNFEQAFYQGACWGEDYELLFTAPVSSDIQLTKLAKKLKIELTKIGSCSTGSGVSVYHHDKQIPTAKLTRFDHVVATSLSARILNLHKKARASGVSIATAESCTAGLVANELAKPAGASDVFKGAILAYTAETKKLLLGIKPAMIAKHGVVSEQVASQMAKSVANKLSAQLTVGITGWAGPERGDNQPVGTIWLAVYANGKSRAVQFQFQGGREQIKHQALLQAITMLEQSL